MTPEEEKQLNEWIKKVENWLGERNASPAVRELVLGDLRNRKVHPRLTLQWLGISLEREQEMIEKSDRSPERKKELITHIESLKTDHPMAYLMPKAWRMRNKNPDIP